jgi:hypothetical protein
MSENEKSVEPDWQRFERAVDIALKTPAKHKIASRKKKKRASTKLSTKN